MSNIKMIVTDLDNTLLTDQKKISDYTLSVITACREKGIKFVPATARALRVLKHLNTLELFPYDALICFNGSKIYLDHELVYHTGIPKDKLDSFLPDLLKHYSKLRISIEMEDMMYVNHRIWEVDPVEKKYKMSDFSDLPDEITDRIILGTPDKSEIHGIRNILPDFLYAHTVEDSPICRILHKSVSKANAIKYLCDLWNIDTKDVVAFGDDFNDMEMFDLCGQAIAVDNAIPELKAVATGFTKNNNEDGEAYWLEKNVLTI